MPRSIIDDISMSLAQNNYFNYYLQRPERYYGFTFGATAFFQQSVHGHRLARYFLPCSLESCDKNALVIAQDGSGDIDSLWLKLTNNTDDFFSTISLCPRRSLAGALFNYHQNLGMLYPGLWMDVNFAFMSADHTLCLQECLASSRGIIPCHATAIEAFNSPEFLFGKLSSHKITKIGVDDLEIKLGYNIFWSINSHLAIYGVLLAPTSSRPEARFLFEPIIGRGHHLGLGFGINGGQLFWCCGPHSLTYLFDVDYRFFLASTECRSVDLCNGDWSRYLLVGRKEKPAKALAGNNLLTVPLRITPRSMLNIWLALHYEYNNLQAEVGYDFWLKEREKVCFAACHGFANDFGIFDLEGALKCSPVSASTATIIQATSGANPVVSDKVFTPITRCRLNLESAAQGLALSHKLYGSLGYDACWFNHSALIAVGGSYEFAQKNTALDQWGIWLKLALGF